ncbi:MAG: 2-vinyl bacteriochlorophyllide hydratase [Betaproteobacteria bacterium]|nr:2-vinyl bacteriochlorophyllide hydratase [Betaproteobacteria bacterium]
MSEPSHPRPTPLYTPEQRWRRDHSAWTLVQGVLAPLQFGVFLVSLALVIRTLIWGLDPEWALISVVVKTVVLYIIMVTGSIWEKVVFGQYLFARSFFWEDVVSMGVMALHTAYVVGWWGGYLSPGELPSRSTQRAHDSRLAHALVAGRQQGRIKHQHPGTDCKQENELHGAHHLSDQGLRLAQQRAHVDHGQVRKALR